MREFLLTISPDGSSTITFIASKSATAPEWATVESNAAKITRTFSGSPREIYFSLTDAYDGSWDGSPRVFLVDLSQASSEEVTHTEAQAPGMMIPGETYYVHAYSDGAAIGSSMGVTLLSYPADSELSDQMTGTQAFDNSSPFADDYLANYSYRMAEWLKPGSTKEFRPIEMGEELFLLPIRYISVTKAGSGATPSNNSCSTMSSVLRLDFSTPGQDTFALLTIKISGTVDYSKPENGVFKVLNHPGLSIPRWDGMKVFSGRTYLERDWIQLNYYAMTCLEGSPIDSGIPWKFNFIR